jgi:hypothetical protein
VQREQSAIVDTLFASAMTARDASLAIFSRDYGMPLPATAVGLVCLAYALLTGLKLSHHFWSHPPAPPLLAPGPR